MATTLNNQPSQTGHDDAASVVFGIIVATAIIALCFFYALPGLRDIF